MAHLFRNVKITTINVTHQEAGGIVRAHCQSEVMPDFCDHMKWHEVFPSGALVEGIESVNLSGMVALSRVTFQPNGMKEYNTKCPAIEARDFVAKRTKGKKGEETHLTFILTFPKASGQAMIMDYYFNVGRGDAVLHLTESGKTDDLDLQPIANDGPALASVREVGGGRKKKD